MKQEILVGGVSSNFRINPHNGQKTYIGKADGCRFWDVKGKEYIDFFMGHGANLLGHNVPQLASALTRVIQRGYYAGLDSEDNLELARLINIHLPAAEAVRYTNSGTESTALVFRLLRGYTDRDLVVRIDGHFHGASEYVIPNNLARKTDRNNPGGTTSRVQDVRGIPAGVAQTIRLIPWNDTTALKALIEQEGERIAGMIVNPIDFNNGCITTTAKYLSEIKDLLHNNGSLLVFDEVLSGFKTGIDCAQGYYGVTPDLCTLSKALSNGVPVSAVAGRSDVLQIVMNKEKEILAGGTYSGNQIGVNAAIETLKAYSRPDFYPPLIENTRNFCTRLNEIFRSREIPAVVQYMGCMFGVYFGTTEQVKEYRQFYDLDWNLSRSFFSKCLDAGLYFHTDFTVSAAHTTRDLDLALEKIDTIAKTLVRT
jgi:glutamate-1-semialdehyde 2,1-aminomutase